MQPPTPLPLQTLQTLMPLQTPLQWRVRRSATVRLHRVLLEHWRDRVIGF